MTEIPSEILHHAFTNWSFFSTQHYVCVHFPAYSCFVCVSITQNSWFHDLPYFQFHCFLMFVCTILTCACTPPNIHIFFILNLQKGKIFFCACVEMRQNSWLQLVLQSFFSYIFILRQKTLLQKLLYPPPTIVLSFSFILNPFLCYPSLPGACFLINSKNCADEVKLFMCGSVMYRLFLLG